VDTNTIVVLDQVTVFGDNC